ncbi:hypothetical protein JQ633_33460 [Bradyrhizobium tropiciagri]|uniref:hypothetical protein n=1 Tax=Bradyrhizobium tropiciagri TaxID=312253 RepID=UPI001BACDF12|nr:hypothetical protein [Bradyrhizobium tropiciagri]MBR0875308.1 hypothetical protein [Bradyrhizobium tropiciagri]
MPATYNHRGVTFSVTRQYDDQFEIVIELEGDVLHRTVRTRLPELAKRRAEMLINRKLRDSIRLAITNDREIRDDEDEE